MAVTIQTNHSLTSMKINDLYRCCSATGELLPSDFKGIKGNLGFSGHGVTALGVPGNSGDDLRNLLRGGIVAGVFHRRGASRQGDVRRKSRWKKNKRCLFLGGC